MALIARHTAVWTGAPGLPGYSQFYQSISGDYTEAAQTGHNSVNDFFDGVASLLPEEISVTVDPVYAVLDVATGEATAEGVVGDPTIATAGTYVGGWNAQVGVLVEWVTNTFFNGRRLRGRTYLVPLGDIGDANGTLTSAAMAVVAAGYGSIVTSAADFVVWHRPKGAVPGSTAPIQSAVVRDHAAVLRSRML